MDCEHDPFHLLIVILLALQVGISVVESAAYFYDTFKDMGVAALVVPLASTEVQGVHGRLRW